MNILPIFVMSLAVAGPAMDHYNAWRARCYELSKAYHERLLKAPYHSLADKGSDRCSDPSGEFRWDADELNIHILVANFFYHHNLAVRRKAYDMLEHYTCKPDKTCETLASLIDAHFHASIENQSPQWREEFSQKARTLHRKLVKEE